MSEPTKNNSQISTVEKIQILLHEYDTLRSEILARSGHMYQIVTLCGALFVLIISLTPLGIKFWFTLGAAIIVVIIFSWLISRDIGKAAKRLREIENHINMVAGDKILAWESHWGGAVTGYFGRALPKLSESASMEESSSISFSNRILCGESAMNQDRMFLIKISMFNAFGILVAVLIPILVDPNLISHALYPSRHYPLNRWLLLLLCPVVYFSCYETLRRSKTDISSLIFSCFFIIIVGSIVALFAFRPERPHMWVIETTFAYSILSFLTVLLRINKRPLGYTNYSSISFQGHIEYLKAKISLWRQITICLSLGYLVLAIVDITIVWHVNQVMVSDRGDQILLFNVSLCSLLLFSLFVVIGPLLESFMRTNENIEELSTIKNLKQRTTNMHNQANTADAKNSAAD